MRFTKYHSVKWNLIAEIKESYEHLVLKCDYSQDFPVLISAGNNQFYRRLLWLYLFHIHCHNDYRSSCIGFLKRNRSKNLTVLEGIQIPTFDGDILKFQNFKSLFENLIHNNVELSGVLKLYYLKQSLIGKANDLVRDFDLNDSSYGEAW